MNTQPTQPKIARIEVVIVLDGPGEERERSTSVVFWAPEKVHALATEPGTMGAVIRDALRRTRR